MDNNQQVPTEGAPPKVDFSQQDGIGSLMEVNGNLGLTAGTQDQDAGYYSTINTPPQKDGTPTAGYGNQTGYGYSNQ